MVNSELDPYMAYCAGLFEGEGYIGCYISRQKAHYRRTIEIKIGMTDREPLDLFHDLMGVGHVYGPYYKRNPEHKPVFEYQVTKIEDVKFVVDEMWLWLSPRRQEQITNALNKYDNWRVL